MTSKIAKAAEAVLRGALEPLMICAKGSEDFAKQASPCSMCLICGIPRSGARENAPSIVMEQLLVILIGGS